MCGPLYKYYGAQGDLCRPPRLYHHLPLGPRKDSSVRYESRATVCSPSLLLLLMGRKVLFHLCVISLRILDARQKPNKPLAMDARCLLRAIDAVAARKSLKQAWIFSARHIITPSRSCIHRKAINSNKPSLSSGCFCSTTDRTD